jgi:hypothetical protein
MVANVVPSRVETVSFFRFILFILFFLLASTPLFHGEGLCAEVTIAWDASNAPELGGYKLYYGTSAKNYSFTIDTGSQTTWQLTGLNEGTTYYFAAKAYTTAGSESEFSSELNYTVSNGTTYPTNLLWRHTVTGQNAVWYMNGTTFISAVLLMGCADPSWKVVGVGDFNADGKPDILWRHTVTGQNAVWYMNGVTLISGVWLPTLTDPNWAIVGVQ